MHSTTSKVEDNAFSVDNDSHGMADAVIKDERELSRWQTICNNPWAFVWAAYGALQILLVSYENQAAGLVVGIPRFRQDFGCKKGDSYVLPPMWQGAHSGGPVAS